MQPKRVKPMRGPEQIIQDGVTTFLEARGWLVVRIIGVEQQCGLPDLWITHRGHGARWLEIKNPLKYEFTPAQLLMFPKILANGSGIWVMTAPTEQEYQRLFGPPNVHHYMGHYKKPF